MSEPETPLQKLDNAIQEFFQETDQLSEGRFVTGWALGASTARIQSDTDDFLPLVTGATYSLGPQTSIVQFAGLAKYLDVVAEKATWEQLSGSDDE